MFSFPSFFFFLNNIAELEREIKCLLTTMCRRRCLKEGNKEGKEETQYCVLERYNPTYFPGPISPTPCPHTLGCGLGVHVVAVARNIVRTNPKNVSSNSRVKDNLLMDHPPKKKVLMKSLAMGYSFWFTKKKRSPSLFRFLNESKKKKKKIGWD